MSNYNDFKNKNTQFTGTEGIKVPIGTTGQRGSTTGQLRFNSTSGLAEYYNGSNFVNIEGTPIVSSISPTSINTSTDALPQNITITGVNFQSGATVTFRDSAGTDVNSPTVTFNSGTSLTAVVPNTVSIPQQPLDVIVTNPTGLIASLTDALQLDAAPTFTTNAGNLGTIFDAQDANHFTIAATDPDGGSVTFAETGATNLSGAGLAISSAGVISGNPNDVSSDTTVSFDIAATDNESNVTTRSFNIIVKQALDGSTTAKAAFSAQDLINAGVSSGSGKYVNIDGTIVQMEYDSTDRFGDGVSGWLKFDSSFRNSYGSNLSPAAYSTGPGNSASWQSNYQNWSIGNQSSHTGSTGIGHVRMKIPRLQYARVETLTGYNSGSQTADDSNVEGQPYDSDITNGHVQYAINRSPQTPNTSGYPISIYNTNLSNSYDTTNRSQGSTGNLIYPYPGGLFGTLGTTNKTVNDFNTVSFASFDSSGVMFMSSWSGDSGSEQIDYSNFTMWIH